MSDLLGLILEAHGGSQAWERARRISARQFVGGALWDRKGHPGALNDVRITVDLDRERVVQEPFLEAGLRGCFTPERVSVETVSGEVVEELPDPRASFAGHGPDTPWSRSQLAYYSGIAMWTFLAEPLSLTFPGVRTEEIDGYTENGRRFRRLGVTYPPDLATLSTDQVLYIGDDGLVHRRDYRVEIAGNIPVTHYVSAHQIVSGLVVPATRMIYHREAADRNGLLLVAIHLEDLTVG